MRFLYLLWDFDGTLFDTYPPLIRAMLRALADRGVTESYAEIARLMGITMDECVSALSRRHNLDAAALEADMIRYHAQTPIHEKPPFPGAIRVCRQVIAAGGGNYIFTHKRRASLFELLDYYGVTGLFADVLSAWDGYARKPDPAGFIALVEKHALPREQVLAIGDRDLDILAGQGAGVHTCLFNAQPSPGVQPDYVIASFEQLEAILGGEHAPSPSR